MGGGFFFSTFYTFWTSAIAATFRQQCKMLQSINMKKRRKKTWIKKKKKKIMHIMTWNHIKNYLFAICRCDIRRWLWKRNKMEREGRMRQAAGEESMEIQAACKLMRDVQVIVFICKLYVAMLASVASIHKGIVQRSTSQPSRHTHTHLIWRAQLCVFFFD